MCFYDQKTFICGDFKWFHFRLQCSAEHRTGMTCRLKLIMSTIYVNRKCENCSKLEKKISRFWKIEQQIMRWKMSNQHSENSKLGIAHSRAASIDVSKRVLGELQRDILKFQEKRVLPFARLDCERGTSPRDENVPKDDVRNNALPSFKLLAGSDSSLPEINEGDELLRPWSNMFMLRLLESESPSNIQGRNGDNGKSNSLPIGSQEQERLAFILTIRLFYVALEALISPEGTFLLPSGRMLSTRHYPEISPSTFEYIQALKFDLLHAGLTSQLYEADAEIESWLPRVIEALRSPHDSVQDAPRRLQRLLATLREIQVRIQCSGFREGRQVPIIKEQGEQPVLDNRRTSHDARSVDEAPLAYSLRGAALPRVMRAPRMRTARSAG